jgi:hypothetical protein
MTRRKREMVGLTNERDFPHEPLGAWGLSTGKTTHRRRVIKICASSPSPSGDSILRPMSVHMQS